MKTIVIGAGYFGVNYIRELSGKCVGAVEPNEDRAKWVAETYNVPIYPDIASVDVDYDGAIIATPPINHVACALEVLRTGRFAMIEKPLATSVEEALPLQQFKGKVMAGNIYLYHPGVYQDLYKAIWRGGKPLILDHMVSRRTNNGPIRPWQNAAWDLAAHDIAIFNFLMRQPPLSVMGNVTYHWAIITLEYSMCFAHIYVSWLGGPKTRLVELVPSEFSKVENRIIFDDMKTVLEVSPMRRMLDQFLSGNWDSRGNLSVGLDVLAVLEAAERG